MPFLIKIISILYPVCFIFKGKRWLIELTRLTQKHDLILHEITYSYELFFFYSVEYQQYLSESEVSVME